MFGLDPVWSIILISSFSNFMVDLFGEVFFEYTAVYLKDALVNPTGWQAACVDMVMPVSFGEAFNVTRGLSPLELQCVQEFYQATYAMGSELQ